MCSIFRARVFALHELEEHEQRLIASEEFDDVTCSSDRFSHVTGLNFCRSIRLPVSANDVKTPLPVFPFHADVTVEKTDSHSRYEFEAKAETRRERVKGRTELTHEARIYFDTPGSRTDRKLLLEASVAENLERVSARLESPWKSASFEGSTTWSRDAFAVTSLLTVDDQSVLSFATAFQQEEVENG